MFPIFVTILPLTIPANYRLSSQFLSVGLKVGVRVWFKVSVLTLSIAVTCVCRHYTVYKVVWRTYTYKEVELAFVHKYIMVELYFVLRYIVVKLFVVRTRVLVFVVCSRVYVVYSIRFRICHPHIRTFCPTRHILQNPAYYAIKNYILFLNLFLRI
jgi:hypothetical protein